MVEYREEVDDERERVDSWRWGEDSLADMVSEEERLELNIKYSRF